MRFSPLYMIVILLSLSLAAKAQESGADLFDELSSLRLKLERLEDAKRAVIFQRDQMAGKLEKLARRIEDRKAKKQGEGILPDFTLQEMLRSSRELSQTLTLLNRELDALEDTRADRLGQLELLYGKLVNKTAGDIKIAGADTRAGLLKTLERLRKERKGVQEQLADVADRPERRNPPLDSRKMLASEDPEELHERVDAVSDEQDRLRRRLAYLDERITGVKEQIRLDREMRDFVRDQALFGEESRILKVSKTSTPDGSNPDYSMGSENDATKQEGMPPGLDGEGDIVTDDYGDPMMGGECSGGMCGTPHGGTPQETGGSDRNSGADGVIETVEGHVPMGVDADDSNLDNLNPVTQLKLLRASRCKVIEQIKKLQILHDRIQEKVDVLRDE